MCDTNKLLYDNGIKGDYVNSCVKLCGWAQIFIATVFCVHTVDKITGKRH